MTGPNRSQRISSANFRPFPYGYVQNPCPIIFPSTRPIVSEVELTHPSRINAMAIDPSGITETSDRIFQPGEVVFPVGQLLKVKVHYLEDGLGKTTYTGKREALVRHAVGLARAAFDCQGSFEIKSEGLETPHVGLGSSGRLITAVFRAINQLFGNHMPKHLMLQYLAQNHGEEISGQAEMLMPVQCIGGSAAAGLYPADMLLITGKNTVIFQRLLPLGYTWILGWPENFVSPDAQTAMEREMESLEKFEEIGRKYKQKIAWRILHELLPAATQGDFLKVGDVIEWYRYDLGSIDACSFSWPSLRQIANEVLRLRHEGHADIVTISSVGPACCVLTRNPDICKQYMDQLGLMTMALPPAMAFCPSRDD